MNRISTLLDPDAGQLPRDMESEGVLGHHLHAHNISVGGVRMFFSVFVCFFTPATHRSVVCLYFLAVYLFLSPIQHVRRWCGCWLGV